jgi:hypothetical protein
LSTTWTKSISSKHEFLNPNPDKPEPTLTAKAKKETKKIEFGTHKGKNKNFLIS